MAICYIQFCPIKSMFKTVKDNNYCGIMLVQLDVTGPKLTLPNSDSGCKAALPEVRTGNVGNMGNFCAFTMAWKHIFYIHFRGFRFNT